MNTRTNRIYLAVASVALLIATALLMPSATQGRGMDPLATGVGVEERVAHPEYPVKLIFADRSGAYLANVEVRVYDDAGKQVLATHCGGPWLFLDLERGEYRVEAVRVGGDTVSARLTVADSGQVTLGLTWPAVN